MAACSPATTTSAFRARRASEVSDAPASEKVSPTAYATGWLWYCHGLSHPGLIAPQSRRLGRAFRLLNGVSRLVGGVSLETMFLMRHRGIDAVLSRAIDEGRVGQVIELAAGLSPRGWRYTGRYGSRLRYIETDLPHMAAIKRRMLADAGLESPQLQVRQVDALAVDGPDSLSAIAATLDPAVGTAIITEGLMNYLDPEQAMAVWQRIAATLRGFPQGIYLADIYPQRRKDSAAMSLFGKVLQSFVKGRLHLHFETPEEAIAKMKQAGFTRVVVHDARDLLDGRDETARRAGEHLRVLEAGF